MKHRVFFFLPVLGVLALTVCQSANETAPAPTAFEQAALTVTGAEKGPVLRRVWAGLPGRLDFSCGGPSPNGELFSLVDWGTGDLAVYDLETGEVRNLTDKGTWNENGSWNECSVFSPDGKRVAFNYANTEGLQGGFRYELRVLDLADPVESQKVLLRLPPNWGWIAASDWSGDEILVLTCSVPGEPNRLAAVNVSDGTARVIKESPDEVPFPAKFSPDGQMIAYQLDSEIRLIGRDGTNDHSTGIDEARLIGWSRSGALLYHVPNAREVRSQSIEEGRPAGEPMVVRGDLTSAFPLGMAGDTLFYGVAVEALRVHTATINWESGRISPPVPVTPTIDGRSEHPTWSPDGRTLAYIHRPLGSRVSRIVLRSARGDETRELTNLDLSNVGGLTWSPDGTALWLQANGDTAPALYRADVRTGKVSKIFEGMGRDFTVGPDGTIYFHRPAGLGVEQGLYAYRPEDGELRRIIAGASPGGHRNLGVSPDGTKIAYSSFDREQQVHRLLVVPIVGGAPREVLRVPVPGYITPIANTMVWSPDGRSVVYRRASDDEATPSTLEMIAINGGEPRVLIEGDAPRHVKLHPDGRRLALTSGSNKVELWTMALVGPAE